jgi:flagellar motility protein MotE (MotC chaperone)
MTRLLRDIRIVPIVLIAISALFVLKATGLILNGSYVLDPDAGDITGSVAQRPAEATPAPAESAPPARQRSWAQQMFNFPDVTGSVGEPPAKQDGKQETASNDKAKAKAKSKAQNPPPTPDGTQVPVEGRIPSPAERAVLERLAERRAELDARAKELEMRESVLLAAEKRLESRIAHLKQLEAQINEAARIKDEDEANRHKNIITMYENMKPKDAARVFDRLDLRILVEVASQINPRRMSDIMAQMAPEAAERLTVELATRSKDKPPAELPKIVGSPPATN